MKKTLLYSLMTVGLLSPLAATRVSAHVLESDGTIGAVLHIDPGDDPVAGQLTGIYFDFNDKTKRFDARACDCRLVIERAGQTIYDQPFTRPGGGTFTFPARDAYTVKAVGSPKSAGAFDAFTLRYDIRVERGTGQEIAAPQASNKSGNAILLIIGVLVTFGVLLGARYILIKNAKPG